VRDAERTRSRIAQLVEQLTVNQRVVGSSPTSGATSKPVNIELLTGFLFFR
jgi:hypothetical protein